MDGQWALPKPVMYRTPDVAGDGYGNWYHTDKPHPDDIGTVWEPLFTADQMRAAYAAGRSATEQPASAEQGRYFSSGPQGHFYTNDMNLARALVDAYDDQDDWTITDLGEAQPAPVVPEDARDAARFRAYVMGELPDNEQLRNVEIQGIMGRWPTLDEWRAAIDAAMLAAAQPQQENTND